MSTDTPIRSWTDQQRPSPLLRDRGGHRTGAPPTTADREGPAVRGPERAVGGADAGGPDHRARLTARGRTAIAIVLLLALAVAFFAGRSGSSRPAGAAPAAHPALVQTTVEPGQTLWELAGTLPTHPDRREGVALLRRLNGLSDGQVRAGQQLLVPLT